MSRSQTLAAGTWAASWASSSTMSCRPVGASRCASLTPWPDYRRCRVPTFPPSPRCRPAHTCRCAVTRCLWGVRPICAPWPAPWPMGPPSRLGRSPPPLASAASARPTSPASLSTATGSSSRAGSIGSPLVTRQLFRRRWHLAALRVWLTAPIGPHCAQMIRCVKCVLHGPSRSRACWSSITAMIRTR